MGRRTRSKVPVALVIFNRPDATRRVLEAVASAKPDRLFVIGDGPRSTHPEDERLVAETRAMIDRLDWPGEIQTNYSAVNLGCTARVSSGLDWVFSQTPEAVILEDDCLPHPSFFPFCEQLLDRYRDSPEVHMISGSNPVGARGPWSYHFSRSYSIWGWATWERSWRHYEEDLRAWRELRETDWIERLLQDGNGARVGRTVLDATYRGEMPWDFYWVFCGWLRDALSITPSTNLVTNIGFGAGATHETDASDPYAARPFEPMSFPLVHPPAIEALQEADSAVWSAMCENLSHVPAEPWWRRKGRSLARRRIGAAPMSGETIVMGSATGLAAAQVLPFLRSLRNCGYEGDVVLFVDRRLASQLRDASGALDISLVPVRTLLPFNFARLKQHRLAWPAWTVVQSAIWALIRLLGLFPLAGPCSRAQRGLAEVVCTPMDARFIRFLSFLATRNYNRVLLADVRDVLFQSDPFDQLPVEPLAVSIESRAYTIATEPHNRAWISDAYGARIVDEVGENSPSCVGVTYGGREAMASYLEQVAAELLSLSARVVRRGGADTAVHNYLLWTGRLGAVRLLETLGSPVATLNGIPEEELHLDSSGRLTNSDGSVPSVVHQYDRQPKIAEDLLRELAH